MMDVRSAISLALTLVALAACASASIAQNHPDEVREIRLHQETKSVGDGSSGSSQTSNTMIERVVAVRNNGVELVYDLPDDASAEERDRSWQFPARVLKTPDGPLKLLNAEELDARLDAWLQRGKIPREACGKWIFTWTAFKIECDPQSVLLMLAPFDLRYNNLTDGSLHRDAIAIGAEPLRRVASTADGSTFAVTMQVDPDFVRVQQAEAQVAVAQMTGQAPLSLEDAMVVQAKARISGTVVFTVETDATGRVTRTSQVVEMDVVDANAHAEHRTATTKVEQSLRSH